MTAPIIMTGDERAESIARWLDRAADAHERRSAADLKNADFHRGIAVLYRARVSDIRAGMDIPDPPRDINTGEIIL